MSIINDQTLSLLGRSLNVSLARQNALASNVANLDTPGFTPRDVDFADALRAAESRDAMGLEKTSDKHIDEAGAAAHRDVQLVERADTAPGPDGNTVDLDAQMARVAENAIFYQANTRAVSKKLQLLKYVVNDGGM
jgi:flagellar basal-body rod protein FlgB